MCKLRKESLGYVLKRANKAVELDNNQGYAAAKEAYLETSIMLEAYLDSNSPGEDREKLSKIVQKKAYDSRLQELRELRGDRDDHAT
ncbi:hypothetical protein BPAE_0279g00010 [Botrytis paeoniae]|uniref:MIT domain-containing protein n=1 Tax=Botrytis paeoniae TaxID=278948 RepID=A0A4Z1FAR9_9HELO|nr:hypothetical protein BPAE_0279g00010 [Botrytis paeoniae]